MARIVWDDETVDLDLGDGDVIKVKARMSAEDEFEIDQLSFAAERDEESGDMRMTMNPAAYSKALLTVMVKGWSGPSFMERDGKTPLAFSQKHVTKLDKATAQQVREFIDKHNNMKRDDEDTKGSTKPSSKP